MWLGGGRKEVLLRDAMKPGSWKWPGGLSEAPKDLTPDELTRGMVKTSASANGSGKAPGAGRDGGSGRETGSTRMEWKPKKPALHVTSAHTDKVSHPGRACMLIHAFLELCSITKDSGASYRTDFRHLISADAT